MRRLRIAFVSAFPPSRGPLSEYGWHLVNSLRQNARVDKVWVLADGTSGYIMSDPRVEVIPCWTFGSPTFAGSVLRSVEALDIDLVWFNLHMTSTGSSRPSWFAGVSAPALIRAAGFKVMVTLHNALGLTNLAHIGFGPRFWDIWAAHVATAMLCRAHVVCVLRPEYVEMLKRRHKVHQVLHVPHGTLGEPLRAEVKRDPMGVLAFGHFGTYKRLEPVLEAVEQLSATGLELRLTVGGTDSRHSPGYLAHVRDRYRTLKNVEFVGYVAEEDVPGLFQKSTLSILPYATAAGMSGVAILSAMHGLPIIASDIAAFRALAREGLSMRFFHWPDSDSLKNAILALLASPEEQERHRRANLDYAWAQHMNAVAARYLDIAESLVSSAKLNTAEGSLAHQLDDAGQAASLTSHATVYERGEAKPL